MLLWPLAAAAQVAISEGGTPNYSHAIAVPPGISGMAPNIGLLYSGGGVNGPVGHGWSIQGISMITRCPAIKAIDGAPRGVDYSAADKLCLDGQRLIQTDATGASLPFPQTNDSLGGTGLVREYRAEKDSFARIRAYGAAGGNAANGPAYFKVWTKSGQIYEYGNNANTTANAAIAIQAKTAISAWSVSRISDTLGNYIDFQYEQRDVAWGSGPTAGSSVPGHEWNLVEIRYTGTPTQQPVNRIRFEYSDRADTPGEAQDRSEAYHQGAKNVSIRRLDAVRAYTNWPGNVSPWPAAAPVTAVKVKAVKLTYDLGPITKRSRLTQIRECVGTAETNCLPPAVFNYAAGGNDSFTSANGFNLGTEVLTATSGAYGVLVGDFNGDGISDLIRWADTPADNRLWLGSSTGAFTAVASTAGGGPFNITDQNLFKSNECHYALAADFDGDGLTDILRIMKSTSPKTGASCGTVRHMLFRAAGDGSFASTDITGISFAQTQSLRTTYYNCISPPSPDYLPGCLEPGMTNLGTSQTEGRNYYLIDVNADGRLDIVTTILPGFARTTSPPNDTTSCAAIACTRIFLGQAGGTFAESTATNLTNRSVYTDPPYGGNMDSLRKQFVQDVDGDGLADLRVNTGTWLSQGNGNFVVDPAANYAPACRRAIDANGDGRSDCLTMSGSASTQRLTISDGTYRPQNTANFNLTAPGQELLGYDGNLVQNAGVEYLEGYDGGRGALLRWHADPSKNKLFIANGDGTFRDSLSFNQSFYYRQLRGTDGTTDFVVGDFTGRGVAGVLRLRANPVAGSESTTNQLYTRTYPTPADQLVSHVSGTGLTTTLTWVPITASSSGALGNRYGSDRGTANAAAYPRIDVLPPLQVVATSETGSGVGSATVKTEYSYAGLKAAYDGRGLQGFRETRRQSPGTDGSPMTIVTRYLQDHPYGGVAHTTETFLGPLNALPASPLSRSTFTYCEKTAAAGAEAAATPTAPCAVPATTRVQRPYLYKSVEQGWELASNGGAALPTVTTTNVFNDTGDPTSIVVTTAGTAVGLSQTFTKTTTNQYLAANISGDNWVLGRLQRASQQNSVPNSLGSIATGYGGQPLANATQGTRQPLVVSIAPASVSATSTNSNLVSAPASVTVSGSPTPTAPLSYAWARVGGATALIGASGGGNPTFSATLAPNQTATETYRVTVTDGAGRTGTADVPVTLALTPPALGVSLSPSPLQANRTNPGTITANASAGITGGVAPYSTSWSRLTGSRISATGTTTASFSASLTWAETVSETFRATVSDAVGQTKTADITVTFAVSAQPAVSVSPSTLNLSRNNPGSVSGTMTATASGGTAPFTYSWVRTAGSRGTLSSATVSNPTVSASLAWGESASETWRVTVTDAASNTASASLNVNYSTPAQPTLSLTPGTLTLSRNNPGSVSAVLTASASGGMTPYSYSWARTAGTRSTLSSSTVATPTVSASLNWAENFSETWQVTLTDAGGNVLTRSATVSFTTPPQPVVSISPGTLTVNATGNGTASGVVTASASGGVGPYSYSWSRIAGTRTSVSNASAANPSISASLGWGENFTDTWQVAVTDSASNVFTANVNTTFTSPPALGVTTNPTSISQTVTTRVGQTTNVSYTSTATASGGVGPYTYAWTKVSGTVNLAAPTNTATGTFQASLTATTFTRSGSFLVTVTDSGGRTATATVSVLIRGVCSGANCP